MPFEVLPLARHAELLSMARQVTGEVLETMFFSQVAPVPCNHTGAVAVVKDWLASRVRFEGSPSGELRVLMSHELARAIAAGFLGGEPQDISGETEGQASCEIGNMICGAILSRLHPDCRVALSPPEVVAPTFAEQGSVHQCFETPDGKLAITICFR